MPVHEGMALVLALIVLLAGAFWGCRAQFVWQLYQSFSINSSASGQQLDATQPDLLFFPFEPEYSTLLQQNNQTGNPFVYLCFTSFDASPPRSYVFGICIDSYSPNSVGQPFRAAIIAWIANRAHPVSGEVSLILQSSGSLDLIANQEVTWSSNTANQSVNRMELVFSGQGMHLALLDSLNKSVWQSSTYPTDVLPPGEWLFANTSSIYNQKIVSWASQTNTAPGSYSLEAEAEGIALYVSFPAPVPYAMWPIFPQWRCPLTEPSLINVSCGGGKVLLGINLDSLGVNCWNEDLASQGAVGGTCMIFQSTGSNNLVNMTFLKIYWDGNLRAHTLQYSASEVTHRVTLMDTFALRQCDLPLRCGPYGICSDTSAPQCGCPGNSTLFHALSSSDASQGCVLVEPLLNTCNNTNNTTTPSNSTQYMLKLEGVDYFSNAFSPSLPQVLTEQGCSNRCLNNCSCLAAFWYNHTQACFHVQQMGSLKAISNNSYVAYLKVKPSLAVSSSGRSGSMSAGAVVVVVLSALVLIALLVFIVCIIMRQRRRDFDKQVDSEEEAILNAIPGLPTRFSYAELHAITNGFSCKLGRGGFGAVYAGTLPNGSKVAVKQLESARQGDKEFRSEVAIMASIHHYNLLGLIGFCAQGAHRLLVYEYMENGSLDQWLFKESKILPDADARPTLSWDLRQKIALGTAQGLAYLHEECRERILHLDIKPQNILLAEGFVAKVADFGLSRLMERDMSNVVTTMRGTPGYMAPEWLKDAGLIDVKCDVFSFGMLLLEIASGRKNSDPSVALQEQLYYPEWAYQHLVNSPDDLVGLDELTNATLTSDQQRSELLNMIVTAFLCVVDMPEWRLSMSQVVKMLESGSDMNQFEAKQLLRRREQQLLFVLMSNPFHSTTTSDHNSSSTVSSNHHSSLERKDHMNVSSSKSSNSRVLTSIPSAYSEASAR